MTEGNTKQKEKKQRVYFTTLRINTDRKKGKK